MTEADREQESLDREAALQMLESAWNQYVAAGNKFEIVWRAFVTSGAVAGFLALIQWAIGAK